MNKTLLRDKNPNEGKLAPNWHGPFEVISAARLSTYKLEDIEGKELPRL